MHGHACQVCGARGETQHSHYSEAAHIQGLGGSHHGPDRLPDLLCLCPNHHVEFGRLAICIDYIDEDWAVRLTSCPPGVAAVRNRQLGCHARRQDRTYRSGL
ncbi:HNH endonuclease [Streptomyces anulatus]